MSRLARLHPHARPERHDVRVVRDVPYRKTGDRAHLLDIYVPTVGTGPFPVVFYVHGGGFQILSKDTHFAMALAFARRGVAVFSMNYRLAPQHKFPAALEDLSFAYEWVAQNAARYQGDTARLFLAGDSAGANLITALTIMATSQRPETISKRVFQAGVSPIGVIPACGILQVSNPERFEKKLARAPWVYDRVTAVSRSYLEGSAGAETGGTALADPLLLLEGDTEFVRPLPPFFAGVGTRDPLIDDTRRLGKALTKRGVRCDVKIYPDEVHTFHAFVWRDQAKQFWRDTYTFIDSCLAR